jgi:hypothetical protein
MSKKIETSEREMQIVYIMENYYYTDDKEMYKTNLSYVEGMSDIEIQVLYDSIK